MARTSPLSTQAEKSAGRRVIFIGHAMVWALSCFFLFVVSSFFPTLVVALAWGIGLACHGYFGVLAPELRQEWTEQELAARAGMQRELSDGRHARSLEELSASIAHEIRNPITAAKSLLQQMRDDPVSPDNVEYAQVALDELDRVERSIAHLLRYAREEELSLGPVDLAEVARDALDHLSERSAQSRARVELDLDGLPPLRGDRDKLRRVVENLVQNALDALDEADTPGARVRVSAGTNLAGDEVWLRVSDNGPGIEPERLAKIWSPFHTSKQTGTGLGLAITKKLIEAHGGSIEASSNSGKGSDFVATFPVAGAAP
jgi:signal transduction histidine kinase